MGERPCNQSLEERFEELRRGGLRSMSYAPEGPADEAAADLHHWQRGLREALMNLLAVHPPGGVRGARGGHQ